MPVPCCCAARQHFVGVLLAGALPCCLTSHACGTTRLPKRKPTLWLAPATLYINGQLLFFGCDQRLLPILSTLGNHLKQNRKPLLAVRADAKQFFLFLAAAWRCVRLQASGTHKMCACCLCIPLVMQAALMPCGLMRTMQAAPSMPLHASSTQHALACKQHPACPCM